MIPDFPPAGCVRGQTTPRRATAGLLICLALTAFLAITAASASAAPPEQFVGTQAWGNPTASELSRLGRAEVRVFRAQFSWRSVEPNRPTDCNDARTRCFKHDYRWGRYDRLFLRMAKAGVRPLPVLLGSPRWASPDGRWVPTFGKPEYKTWKRQAFYDFARAAAKRYGTKGTFWRNKSYATSAVRARFWQVWNEPNLPNYWWNQEDGRKTAVEYGQLLIGTDSALKAGNASSLTLTGGVPWSNHATLDPPSFLQRMYSSKPAASSATDFVAIHPYAGTPGLVIEGVRLARRALGSTAARSRPLWLTEFGWAQSGPSSTFTTSVKGQAKYLRDTYRALLKYRSTYGIKGAFWFNLINLKRSSDAWYYHTGLFRADRETPWDSWWALRCVTSGRADFCRYGR